MNNVSAYLIVWWKKWEWNFFPIYHNAIKISKYRRDGKSTTFTPLNFSFFFPKVFFDERSGRKNNNVKISGHMIPAKRYTSNYCCRIKKSFLGLQYVQELWLLWHERLSTFKNQFWEPATSTGWVSSSLGNQGTCIEKSLCEFIWAWNRCMLCFPLRPLW